MPYPGIIQLLADSSNRKAGFGKLPGASRHCHQTRDIISPLLLQRRRGAGGTAIKLSRSAAIYSLSSAPAEERARVRRGLAAQNRCFRLHRCVIIIPVLSIAPRSFLNLMAVGPGGEDANCSCFPAFSSNRDLQGRSLTVVLPRCAPSSPALGNWIVFLIQKQISKLKNHSNSLSFKPFNYQLSTQKLSQLFPGV